MIENRLTEIKHLLQINKKVLVNDLSQRYHISTVTIRKDLALLEDEGFATRIYGGAILAESAKNISIPLVPQEQDLYCDPRHIALALKACEKIEDGDTIFLGSGRTCRTLGKMLTPFKNLSVVTNNISALGDLLGTVSRIYLIGGEVTATDQYTLFSSPENPQTLTDNIFVNKAFTSISGLDLKAGLTVNSIISTYIYRSIPSLSRDWYLLADSTKFNHISMYPIADLSQVSCLITDNLPDEYIQYYKENNLDYLIASD